MGIYWLATYFCEHLKYSNGDRETFHLTEVSYDCIGGALLMADSRSTNYAIYKKLIKRNGSYNSIQMAVPHVYRFPEESLFE